MVDIQSPAAEIIGEEKRRRKKERKIDRNLRAKI